MLACTTDIFTTLAVTNTTLESEDAFDDKASLEKYLQSNPGSQAVASYPRVLHSGDERFDVGIAVNSRLCIGTPDTGDAFQYFRNGLFEVSQDIPATVRVAGMVSGSKGSNVLGYAFDDSRGQYSYWAE